MSEFTNTAKNRIGLLNKYMLGIIEGGNGAQLIKVLGIKTENFIPSDLLGAFNQLFEANDDLEKMKMASNKLFNILYEILKEYPSLKEKPKSFIDYLKRDNAIAAQKLKEIKPFIKKVNQKIDKEILVELNQRFSDLEKFTWHYTVKENVLFPILETNWQEHDCLKLMWSFHDDIRKNFRKTIDLAKIETFDLKAFNKYASLLFFNISTIIFREEYVLFPLMLETFDENQMDKMLHETSEMTLPFVNIDIADLKATSGNKENKDNYIKFPTGEITVEQAEMVFNHLPVDITYVDENDEVRYFSTPKHRIFPRTAAIIGRKIQNCHPPESVGVVDRIVDSFKKGEKEVASFWIHMGPKYVLIQYFAVHDKENKYRGVLEVSQEISEIQEIKGDRRLLDW
ncbi:MAG: hypothetical protein DRI74_05460 [Bacteroidetes bacterium]|nr:MAG: hypothetical protein DRI74_05460 [Bacteroidota bacterium]